MKAAIDALLERRASARKLVKLAADRMESAKAHADARTAEFAQEKAGLDQIEAGLEKLGYVEPTPAAEPAQPAEGQSVDADK